MLIHFTQTDPMPLGAGSAFEGSYVYGLNNPMMYTDPSGLRGSNPGGSGRFTPIKGDKPTDRVISDNCLYKRDKLDPVSRHFCILLINTARASKPYFEVTKALVAAASERRAPDYIVVEGSMCGLVIAKFPSGCGVVDVAVTRFGHVFGAVGQGGSSSPGVSMAARGGWITNVKTTTGDDAADSASIDSFLSGYSSSAGVSILVPVGPASVGISAAVVQTSGFQTSVEAGLIGSTPSGAGPSAGVTRSYGVRVVGATNRLW